MKSTKSRRARSALLGAAGVLTLLLVWQASSELGWVNGTYFPPPTEVFAALGRFVLDLNYWRTIGNTLLTWAIGLAIAGVSALVLGTVVGLVPVLRRYTRSTVEFLRPIPSVAIIPLAILLFGLDRDASLVIVVYATFWQIFIQVLYGVADVDPVARDTQRSFGLGTLSRFRYLVLPTALPYIMTGVRVGVVLATVSVVVAEFVAGRIGLGAVMIVGYAQLDTPLVFGALFVLTLIGLAYYLSALLLETVVLRWFNLAHPAD